MSRSGADETVRCAHCSLPVPPGLVEDGAERQFCCQGCRTVWEAIHGSGLEDYYRLREELAAAGTRPAVSGRGFQEFDHERFQELHVRRLPNGLARVELYLEGVHCAACVWLVEKLPRLLAGLVEARLHLGRAVVEICWDPTTLPLSAIARALDRLGYQPHPVRAGSAEAQRRDENRRALARLGVSGMIAGNVMLIAFALYGGWLHGMDPAFRDLFRWTSLVLTLLQLAWPGRVFFTGALAALRTRTSHMDLPIALGLLAGLTGGFFNTWTGSGEVYFESVNALVFFLLVGRTVQQRQQRAAYRSIELLTTLTPTRARRLEAGGDAVEVPLEAVTPGDRLEVRAGESIPADGRILTGETRLDRSILSGESRPVAAGPGDPVHAGTVNLSSRIEIRVEATGEETRVGRLMQLVERYGRERAPVVRLADRLSGWFVVVVLGLAAVNLLLWWRQDPRAAVEHTVALLIVACPCALGLATPLAVAAAVGAAARRGILIKGGEVLERLARPGRLFLDKTGTLTRGRVGLVAWSGPREPGRLVAALEAHSGHHYAAALRQAFADLGPVPPAEEVEEVAGRGIRGRVEGHDLLVGSPRFLAEAGVPLAEETAELLRRQAAEGLTPVLVAVDGRHLATAGLGDALLPDAAEAVAELR
ncbi:MAG: heavy metal translocating P-type ATPase, partial [Planctomycetota bacterium]